MHSQRLRRLEELVHKFGKQEVRPRDTIGVGQAFQPDKAIKPDKRNWA